MPRRLLLLVAALLGCLAWPAQAFAATGALLLQSASVGIPGTDFKIDLTLSRGRYFGDQSPDLSFQLSRVAPGDSQVAAELHLLQFSLPPWSLAMGDRDRSGQLHAEGWLGRWGSMNMSFAASGKAVATSKDVGSCSSVPASLLKGRLTGKLVLKLPGIGNVRLTSIPVTLTDYPSLPSGCFAPTTQSCSRGNATATDGSQLLAELQLDTLFAGPQQAGPEVTEFYLDASNESAGQAGAPLNLAVLGFLDSPQQTRPALVIHYLVLETLNPALSVDAGAATALVAESGVPAQGSLSFTPTAGIAPIVCGDVTQVVGRVTGSLAVDFSWGGTRQFNGDAPATLTLGPPSAPAPLAPPAPQSPAAALAAVDPRLG
jgi:hypothetical protein